MFEIVYSRQATKALSRLPRNIAARIQGKLVELAENPYASNNNVTALQGQAGHYRFRVGDWRVVYEIDGEQVRIAVIRIAPRGQVYK